MPTRRKTVTGTFIVLASTSESTVTSTVAKKYRATSEPMGAMSKKAAQPAAPMALAKNSTAGFFTSKMKEKKKQAKKA